MLNYKWDFLNWDDQTYSQKKSMFIKQKQSVSVSFPQGFKKSNISCLMVACFSSLPNFHYWISHTLYIFLAIHTTSTNKWYKSWIRIYNTLEHPCWWSFTPMVSRVPRKMWYLIQGKSLTFPPLPKITKCSCALWPILGI